MSSPRRPGDPRAWGRGLLGSPLPAGLGRGRGAWRRGAWRGGVCLLAPSRLALEVLGEDGPRWSFPPALPAVWRGLIVPAGCAALRLGLAAPCPEDSGRGWGLAVRAPCPGRAGVQGHCHCSRRAWRIPAGRACVQPPAQPHSGGHPAAELTKKERARWHPGFSAGPACPAAAC